MTRSERHRQSIRVGKAIRMLNETVAGRYEPTPQQIQAARILINKVVPDATPERELPNEIKDITHSSPYEMLRVIEGKAERIK